MKIGIKSRIRIPNIRHGSCNNPTVKNDSLKLKTLMTTVVCNLWTFVLAGQKKKAGGGGGREGRGGRGSLPQLCGRGQRETQARRPSSLLEHS